MESLLEQMDHLYARGFHLLADASLSIENSLKQWNSYQKLQDKLLKESTQQEQNQQLKEKWLKIRELNQSIHLFLNKKKDHLGNQRIKFKNKKTSPYQARQISSVSHHV